ncbi:O-antigen ligase family protein [Ornithinimicrobium sp. LYQ103]|uniref:O-antigen ligase family protein n=1 Tax=Ornithinimicrobium sp. LYQ103 TaxID=3378796 RepID=UPI00385501A5
MLTRIVVEAALDGEMSEHMVYDNQAPGGCNRGNLRNGAVPTELGMPSKTVYRLNVQSRTDEMLADFRSVALAGIAGMAVVNPSFGLRGGAILAVLLLVSQLGALRLSGAALWATLYAATAVLSFGWTAVDRWGGVANVVACVSLFLAGQVVIQRRRDVFLVAGGVVVGSMVGVVQLLLGQGGELRWSYAPEAERIGLGDVNFNATAYSFATAAALLTIFLFGSKRKGPSLLITITAGIAMYIGILLNGTRGALIGLIALLVWLSLARFHGALFGWLIGLVALLSLALSLGVLDGWFREIVGGASIRETGDLNGRLLIWPIARDFIAERPVLGYGVDSFPVMNRLGIGAHNWVLDVTVGLGLVGLLIFARFLHLAIVVEPRQWHHPRRQTVVGAFVVVSTPIMLSGFWVQSPVLWLSLAVIAKLSVLKVPSGDCSGSVR